MNIHTPDESIEKQLAKIIDDVKTNGEIIDGIADDAAKIKVEEKDGEEPAKSQS